MLSAKRLLFPLLIAFHAASHAVTFSGHWEYVSKSPDLVSGEPESLILAIHVAGKTLCGSYMSAYRGGMKLAEGTFKGTLSGGKATVVYDAEWAGRPATGKATLRLVGKQLEWAVTQPAPETDYVIQVALLSPAKPRLESPESCKK